ncbi:30S ribosomal protein S6--L-glutamate ligase [Maritalea sp.]|uniref:30S ribosomal protein S6--L-glutamate ligase n=1 Tax=Maritalea sp. TaxID=2003361 RepID=UPI003EFAE539
MSSSDNGKPKIHVGHEEWVSFPDLGLPAVLAKVDTGAKTSSLHAFSYEEIEENGKRMIRFGVQPIVDRPDVQVWCTAPLVAYREIVSSNGMAEVRPIVSTTLKVADQEWEIELSLSDRESMNYRKLLGRTAMEGRIVVDPLAARINGDLDVALYDKPQPEAMQRQLRVALLSREPNSYSSKRIIEEAKAHDIQLDVINTTRCYMNITANNPAIHYQGKQLPYYDAIIPRFGTSVTSYGLAVVRQFEMIGSFCLNNGAAIASSRDKLNAHQVLAKSGIQMPTTGFAHSPSDISGMLGTMGQAPFVLKLLEGAHGRGVVLAETMKAAESVIAAFGQLKADILVQDFVAEAEGVDIRCIVLGNKVIGAIQRKAADGDFRSNLQQGGKTAKVKISKQERMLAIKAAKVMGLRFAGVDMLRSKDGPKVLEVNSSPGLEGLEKTTGIDVAGPLLDYVAKYARLPAGEARRKRA